MPNLPIEVLAQIFQHLDPFKIAKYRRVCRSFNGVLTAHPFSNLIGIVHIGHTKGGVEVFCFVTPATFGEDFLTKVQKHVGDYLCRKYPSQDAFPINPLTAIDETSLFKSFPCVDNDRSINVLLAGPLPNSIGNLKHLTSLDFDGHILFDPIPRSLGDLVKLTKLNLRDNILTGPIPSELGNLVNLKHLNLSETGLDGAIPDSLGNLINLEVLEISGVKLSGPIPASFINLVNLEVLNLGGNELSGKVPDVFEGMNSLRILILSDNCLKGPIPHSIGRCLELTNL
ncbi:hypothetical protein HDU81_011205, partial [Chytriomyces hyalinus]